MCPPSAHECVPYLGLWETGRMVVPLVLEGQVVKAVNGSS